MFFRIPDEFLLKVEISEDLDLVSSEYRSEDIEENPFEEVDEEYINEVIEK